MGSPEWIWFRGSWSRLHVVSSELSSSFRFSSLCASAYLHFHIHSLSVSLPLPLYLSTCLSRYIYRWVDRQTDKWQRERQLSVPSVTPASHCLLTKPSRNDSFCQLLISIPGNFWLALVESGSQWEAIHYLQWLVLWPICLHYVGRGEGGQGQHGMRLNSTTWILPKEPEELDEENTNYHRLLDRKKERILSLAPEWHNNKHYAAMCFEFFGENTIKRNPHIDNMTCVKVTEMHSQVCKGPKLILPEINYSKENPKQLTYEKI